MVALALPPQGHGRALSASTLPVRSAGCRAAGTHLETNPACPTACPSAALSTPIPGSERWHYSLGHWLESDPSVGAGAFSSAGAFGFYPWIDADRTYYGVLACAVLRAQAGYESAQCGRLIRQAWLTGVGR